jgi:hypothetical protein
MFSQACTTQYHAQRQACGCSKRHNFTVLVVLRESSHAVNIFLSDKAYDEGKALVSRLQKSLDRQNFDVSEWIVCLRRMRMQQIICSSGSFIN